MPAFNLGQLKYKREAVVYLPPKVLAKQSRADSPTQRMVVSSEPHGIWCHQEIREKEGFAECSCGCWMSLVISPLTRGLALSHRI